VVLTPTRYRLAQSREEIEPLVQLCKEGKVFQVQEWIVENRPVDPPVPANRGNQKHTPLRYAIERGFHSLVEVLLEGGASIGSEYGYCPMSLAISKQRLDLVKLIADHGFQASKINMDEVFEAWEPEIMEFFIENGADVETGMPLATALCNRTRTALRIFKKYRDRFPSFQEQANVALRHHCQEGNLKWVSLLLWAGADPFTPGESEPGREIDPEDGGLSALGFAALWGNYKVFTLKQIKISHDHPAVYEILKYAERDEGYDLIHDLLKQGMNPNEQDNGGCSAIQSLLVSLDSCMFMRYSSRDDHGRRYDTETARNKLKLIHLLAKYGGKWIPAETGEITEARRSLLKMTADYTVEFTWIMSKYQGCSRTDIKTLLKTPTIKKHTKEHRQQLEELIDQLSTE
tara:strand:- start:207172 stop:208380 length:1209 start_codon:yes stop_codon:yes gene_type:complete